ncbi:MAG: outer membrane protein transport protein [Deltaproteobacteria bacterium]|nr:outer membrane protein transport protein [Deltaproteobacteria bacterium]
MRHRLVIVALSVVAAPAAAQVPIEFGSSPNPVGSGARALGWGSAFIAVADDATAASWNPGALIVLERPEASVVLSLKQRRERFSGAGVPAGEAVQTATYPGVNYASLAYPFKLGSRFFVASLSYQALIDFDKRVQKSYFTTSTGTGTALNAQDDVTFSQVGSLRAVTPALAFQLSPTVALGAAVTVWTDKLGYQNGWRQEYDVQRTVLLGTNAITSSVSSRERFGLDALGMNLGLLWDLSAAVTLGAVVKTPVVGTLTHTLDRFASSDTSIVLATPAAYRESFRLPPSYGLGLAYRFSDELTVSADAYRIEWELFRQVETEVVTGEKKARNPISHEPYADARVAGITQAHLGVERLFIFSRTVVPARAGVFYDPEPGMQRTHHFLGVALGTGVSIGDVVVDAAYQARFATNASTDPVRVGDPNGATRTVTATGGNVVQHLLYLSSIVHF